jgi:hypothetical protein
VRRLTIIEGGGVITANTATEEFVSTTLEGLLEKLDPGNDPATYNKAAGLLNRALGPERDTGFIRQGVVGT